MNKVSIIIPVYNGEKYLKRCLDSVLNQKYGNIEIIIVDDCSTDKTRNIIKKYTDKRIKSILLNENSGVSKARNVGLDNATGDYIVFVDSDDEITDDCVSLMMNVSLKYDSDYVDNYGLLIYEQNNKIKKFTEGKIPKDILVLGTINDDKRVLNMATYVKGKLIKSSLIGNLRFDVNLRCYEDMVFEHSLKSKVKNYAFLNKVVYMYYQRSNSIINTLGEKHVCYIDAANQVAKTYENSNKEIRNRVEAMLVQNWIFTIFTKIIKNDDNIDINTKKTIDYLTYIGDIFPNYKDNKYINSIIKKKITSLINNKNKIKRWIKILKKLNFINLYFKYLSIFNKYKEVKE